MNKYKLTWERSQRGKAIPDWKKETIVESETQPKLGEGKMLTVYPPVYEYITNVEKI